MTSNWLAQHKSNPSGIRSRLDADRSGDIVNVLDYYPNGYTPPFDGSTHALSTVYGSLAAAQADYPFITSTAQTIDYAACQQAMYVAFGTPASPHNTNFSLNRAVRFPAGRYMLGSDTIFITKLRSGKIYGDGKLVTALVSSTIAFQTDGCWFCHFSDMSFEGAGTTAFDLNGNIGGVSGFGVQGNVFTQCGFFAGGSATYGFAMTRSQADGYAAQGSENTFIGCHFSGATTACYYQAGSNALHNTFIGGDMQTYNKYGFFLEGGNVLIEDFAFENGNPRQQYDNDGWDFYHNSGSSGEKCTLLNCRSEGFRFANAEGISVVLISCLGIFTNSPFPNTSNWVANTPVSVGQICTGVGTGGYRQLFFCTTGGTTHNTTEPTWPNSGTSTVNDNGVIWERADDPDQFWITNTNYNIFPDRLTYHYSGMKEKCSSRYRGSCNATLTINSSQTVYLANGSDTYIGVDTGSGNVTITIPYIQGDVGYASNGQKLTVKKLTTDANTVTISAGDNFDGGSGTDVIAGGSRGYRQYIYAPQDFVGTTPSHWVKVGSS